MKIKNYQMQNLQRAILANSAINFDPITAFRIAQLSSTLEKPVQNFEKVLKQVAEKYKKTNENNELVFDKDWFSVEATPLMHEEVDINIPEEFVIEYKKWTEFTVDFIKAFFDVFGDKLSIKETL